MEPMLLYITSANREEAILLCGELLAARLIACGNIIEHVTSLYRWQGEIRRETEVLLLAKTLGSKVEQVVERVKALHSYDRPCVVALPMTGGNPEFMEWIRKEVGGGIGESTP